MKSDLNAIASELADFRPGNLPYASGDRANIEVLDTAIAALDEIEAQFARLRAVFEAERESYRACLSLLN